MRLILLLSFVFGSFTGFVSADEIVRLTKGLETVKVTIGDEVFTVFNYQAKWKKPFFLPVSAAGGLKVLADEIKETTTEPGAPGNTVMVVSEDAELRAHDKSLGKLAYGEMLNIGEVKGTELFVTDRKGWVKSTDVVPLKANVTRLVNENPPKEKNSKSPVYYDHPHHKGIWFSIDEVNDIKFWAEQGTIRNVSVEVVQAEGSSGVLKYTNHWLGTDEKPVLVEETTVRIFPNRLMVFDFTLRAAVEDVKFGDTKEGLFAVRLPNSMRENVAGGPIMNAEGLQGSKECWGQTSPWVDYVGPVGSQKYGVTLMDGPRNVRKSRYHVRDYGLFSMSPFGQKSYTNGKEPADELHLKNGESFKLRYGLFVHHGDAEAGGVAEAYEQFAAIPQP